MFIPTILLAVTALVRTDLGESRVDLEEVSDSHYRFTMKKGFVTVPVVFGIRSSVIATETM